LLVALLFVLERERGLVLASMGAFLADAEERGCSDNYRFYVRRQ
jgi:hypothetical protein